MSPWPAMLGSNYYKHTFKELLVIKYLNINKFNWKCIIILMKFPMVRHSGIEMSEFFRFLVSFIEAFTIFFIIIPPPRDKNHPHVSGFINL